MRAISTYTIKLILLIVAPLPAVGQVELWGTTRDGAEGLGCIFKTNYDGTDQQIIHSFSGPYPGSVPMGDLIQASNGKLYGYTSQGGQCGSGNLFEYDLVSGNYVVLFDFDLNTTGGYMNGHPIQAANGKLYGVTSSGGPANMGTLFEYDPVSQNFVVLTDFTGQDFGSNEAGGIIQATNGKFYGLGAGGTGGAGVIYEYDPSAGTLVKLYDFPASGIDGFEPWGGLMQATNGKLYGMTAYGGVSDYGVIFEYDIIAATFTKKIDLTNITGRYPYGTLMQASSGLIYGMASEGGSNVSGTLFEYDPVLNIAVPRIDFDGTVGSHPLYGNVCEASNGNLYGMTTDGGINYSGSLFEYNPVTQSAIIKVSFDGLNGFFPSGGLLSASNGKLYGLTDGGGVPTEGNLFEYDYVSDSLATLVEFNLAPAGAYPAGGLTTALNGKLYGITQRGGAYNLGLIYEIDPVNNGFDTIVSLGPAIGDAAVPMRVELCAALNGKLYGITPTGGVNSNGALFEFDPALQSLTKKADFSNATTGNQPGPALMQASDGKLYGTSRFGGANNAGTLFSYDITGNILAKVFDFNNAVGTYPGSRLRELSSNNLYGTTIGGAGNGEGSVFMHHIASGTTVKKADLSTATGSGYGELFPASNGTIYGMNTLNGANGQGTIYSIDTAAQALTVLHDFDGTNAININTPGYFTEVAGGKLFAMREIAGINMNGDLFEFDMATNTYTRKIELNCGTGHRPASTGLTQVNTESSSLVWPGDCNFDMQANNTDFLWIGLASGQNGTVRPAASNNWTGQPSPAWSTTFNNSVNHKHVDCNGDGIVNFNDSVAISLNYNLVHPFRSTGIQNPAMVAADIRLIATSNAIAPGSAVDFDIYLADSAIPLDSLYGIAFSLEFDPSLVDASQTSLSWTPSVLGVIGVDLESYEKHLPASGRVEAALSRTDHLNVANLYGVIGRLHLVASASVGSITNLTVTPSLVTGITTGEQQLTFNSLSDSVVIDPALIGLQETYNDLGIYVYPNPARTWLQVGAVSGTITGIYITDSRGARVHASEPEEKEIKIAVDSFKSGIYTIEIIAGHGVLHKKIVIR